MRSLLFSTIAVPLLLGSLPALAQAQPSAEQLLQQLRPKGDLLSGGTRGIRLAAPGSDAPTPALAGIPSPRHQPQLASNKSLPVPTAAPPEANLTVNFAIGSAELTPEARQTLNTLGQVLASKDLQGYRFRIEGHTDTVGSREYNRVLSGRRAEAVVAYVAKTYGVDPGRLQAVGMGEDELLVQTPSQTAEPRNRRVLVINLGA